MAGTDYKAASDHDASQIGVFHVKAKFSCSCSDHPLMQERTLSISIWKSKVYYVFKCLLPCIRSYIYFIETNYIRLGIIYDHIEARLKLTCHIYL